jgi:hypothetical protein
MPNESSRQSPAEKKAARDATRRALRERKRDVVDALRADWQDRDADAYNHLKAALTADGASQMTPWLLFGLASRAISQLADATGTSREDCLSSLFR